MKLPKKRRRVVAVEQPRRIRRGPQGWCWIGLKKGAAGWLEGRVESFFSNGGMHAFSL